MGENIVRRDKRCLQTKKIAYYLRVCYTLCNKTESQMSYESNVG